MINALETREYIEWFDRQSKKEQAQIQARIARIRTDGHFGIVRKNLMKPWPSLNGKVAEEFIFLWPRMIMEI